jgi:nickel-dependent lactate racemase
MACEDARVLTEDGIRAAIENPIGGKPLRRLAEGRKEVVILIDDMTRPTKTHQYLPPILETLREVGIPRDNIRFIMASGSHGPYDRLDFVKKLGEEIVAEYQTYNHNPYEYLCYIGETSRGTPLYVNAEVMNCDLKIGIGTILFHRLMGFSGGGKMIMPGVSALRWHRTEAPKEMDVVVANAYMRASEAVLALWPAYASVKEDGTIVLIPNAPEGQVNHWVFGKHGKFIGARLYSGRRPLERGRRLIIYSPYKERSLDMRLGDPKRTIWLRDWEEVLEVLGSEHGPHPRVAILPDATSGIPETRIGD